MSAAKGPRPDSGPLVLVVDDDATIRALLSDILADLGFATLGAASGEDAIATIGLEHDRVKLAIVDLVLPGISGLETMRALRRVVPGLPGIISTGYGEEAGADAGDGVELLAKPYRIEALADAIARALAGSQPT